MVEVDHVRAARFENQGEGYVVGQDEVFASAHGKDRGVCQAEFAEVVFVDD